MMQKNHSRWNEICKTKNVVGMFFNLEKLKSPLNGNCYCLVVARQHGWRMKLKFPYFIHLFSLFRIWIPFLFNINMVNQCVVSVPIFMMCFLVSYLIYFDFHSNFTTNSFPGSLKLNILYSVFNFFVTTKSNSIHH